MQIYKNFTYYSKYSTIKEKLGVKELEVRSWMLDISGLRVLGVLGVLR